jgi:recombination protein RecA
MVKAKKGTSGAKATIAELIKKHEGALDYGNSEIFTYERIAFDIPALDKLLGGGIPKKRLSIFAGASNAGKSYLAMQAVVQVQKAGGTAVWIDAEMSWDATWAAKCGIDVSQILVVQPPNGEAAFDLMESLMIDRVDLIVLDSIAGLVPKAITEENYDYNPMAWQARFMNRSLPRIIPHLKHGSAVVFINQMRAGIGPIDFLQRMPGGQGQGFYSHLVLEVRRDGWITEKVNGVDTKVGFDVQIRNRKAKVDSVHQGSCIIPFKFGGGFDIIETYIREAISLDLIVKGGSWYTILSTEDRFQGMGNVKQYYVDNPEEFERLMDKINGVDDTFVQPDFTDENTVIHVESHDQTGGVTAAQVIQDIPIRG